MITVLIILLLLIVAIGGSAYFYVTRLSRIPAGYVGVVHRQIPKKHPGDKFEVRIHKSTGPQADLLRANSHYWRIPVVSIHPGERSVMLALI